MNDTTLILASASPRRRELLSLTGLPFRIDAPDVDETCSLPPREAVKELSRRKALAAAKLHPGCVILAADTLVSVDEKALGKPQDAEDAFRMLSGLQGRTHQVYTGVALVKKQTGKTEVSSFFEQTDVTMYPMGEEEIRGYIATSEPKDKAGAYGIQGRAAIFVKEIRGDYNNVVGLPIGRLYQELKDWMKEA